MKVPERDVVITDAVRTSVPLWVCSFGASGSGKTMTNLEVATGVQEVVGGDIYGIDTEGGRMLAYSDYYKFKHVPMSAPFGSLDYLAFIETIYKRGGRIIVIDSASHEHEGVGGLLDFQEQEVERMAKGDWQKAERVKMLAWQKPKAARRQLLNAMIGMKDVSFLLCFRASDTSKPVKGKDGKTEVQHIGFRPLGGPEFVYEATVSLYLPPAAKGVPLWDSENASERMMSKLPRQFEGLFKPGERVTREHGRKMAEWARGGVSSSKSSKPDSSLADQVNALKAALKKASSIEKLKSIWSHEKAVSLRANLSGDVLDDLTLTYESRFNELEAA
jgi:hypothetical protein